MTHDEMIEAVAKRLDHKLNYLVERDTLACDLTKAELLDLARAAIRVIAPAVLEEAAKFLEQETQYWPDPAYGSMLAYVQAIRAMKTRYEQ